MTAFVFSTALVLSIALVLQAAFVNFSTILVLQAAPVITTAFVISTKGRNLSQLRACVCSKERGCIRNIDLRSA